MKLQQIRTERGLSQLQLSQLTGIPKQSIQRYEIGYRNIDGANLNNLCKFAAALDCKIYDIIEDDELIALLKKVI